MKSILEVLRLSSLYLQEKGIENSRRQAEDLVSGALKMNRLDLYMHFDKPLSEKELGECRERLARRAKREPFEYISGEVEFYGCRLTIDSRVLIPRQETEILVDKAVQVMAKASLEGKVLWDLCCGSGCIGIALKKRFPQLRIVLADLSDEALAVAEVNASRNKTNVEIRQGDFLGPFKGEKADFVLCNPPYISEVEYEKLESDVKHYEPKVALFAGISGLEFYERLSQELPGYLESKARIWLEIGYEQGRAIENLFNGPPWKSRFLEKDWSGHDRFFSLENE